MCVSYTGTHWSSAHTDQSRWKCWGSFNYNFPIFRLMQGFVSKFGELEINHNCFCSLWLFSLSRIGSLQRIKGKDNDSHGQTQTTTDDNCKHRLSVPYTLRLPLFLFSCSKSFIPVHYIQVSPVCCPLYHTSIGRNLHHFAALLDFSFMKYKVPQFHHHLCPHYFPFKQTEIEWFSQ